MLHALGVIPAERLLKLRRLGGLDGHPDVGVPGIEANSGSLGMGISKGRGMAWAKRFLGRGGRVVVMTGDGELQEGQNFEALQAAAHQRVGNLWVIVDRNELQSDKPTDEILALGDLEAKLACVRLARRPRATATTTMRCAAPSQSCGSASDAPKALVANTIKGKGVSFMEHPRALRRRRWHVPLARGRARRRVVRPRARRARRAHPGDACRTCAARAPVRSAVDRARSLEGEPESGAATARAQ